VTTACSGLIAASFSQQKHRCGTVWDSHPFPVYGLLELLRNKNQSLTASFAHFISFLLLKQQMAAIVVEKLLNCISYALFVPAKFSLKI
jgi:hypothetical protein